MKGRVIVLDTPAERGFAAALMVDGRLEDLLLDPPKGSNLPATDDICVVKVTRVLPKGGAFCEMAEGAQGFIREAKGLRQGQHVLAQVVSLPEPGKAVTLTTRILIKGPRLILTPGRPGVNVSRKIGNEAERERLKAAVEEALQERLPEADDLGVIVRTSARGEPDDLLTREFGWLAADWKNWSDRERSDDTRSGSDGAAMTQALREWVLPRPDAIISEQGLAKVISDAGDGEAGPPRFRGDPSFPPLIRPEPDPFEAMGVHDAMRALASPEVALGTGKEAGSMIIEPTRALVAVDVNTGADFSPAAGLKANLAVARDLPRQLRLRGLGGKIAVDFAPMPKKDRRTLEEALAKSFRADPVETALAGWTPLGLFELQRKRERRPLSEVWTP